MLAWLMGYVGAPVYLIGFLVPLRESGSMLPQIFIAGYIRRKEVRKWVWVAGSIFQFISIAGIALTAIYFRGAEAGWLIMGLLIIFSLARGLCSVASKDVTGKTIPKTRRGRLNGFSTSISGLFILAAGIFMMLRPENSDNITFYSTLLFFAAALWLLAAGVYSFVNEYPGETSGGGNAIKEAMERISLLKEDKPFRNFVISRALLLCSALTAPFYVVLAQRHLGNETYLLGLFVLANGIASSVSAPFWGKMADISSKKVMVRAAIISASLGIVIFAVVILSPLLRSSWWIYPLSMFVLGIAHSGVRLGRKTYIIDMAGGNKRTDYVAVSNTIIGVILLLTGGISALASMISPEGIIFVLSLFGIAGALTSSRLPDV